MKYLITGANGYIGQGVVKTMLDLGAEVVATDFHTDDVDPRAKRIDADSQETDTDDFLSAAYVISPDLLINFLGGRTCPRLSVYDTPENRIRLHAVAVFCQRPAVLYLHYTT